MGIYKFIDPQVISDCLAKPYEHYLIPESSKDYDEDEFDTNTFILKLSKQITLTLWENHKQLVINITNNNSKIEFEQITRVITQPKLKYVIFESKTESNFSQLRIDSEGQFQLDIMRAIKYYDRNWGDFSEENLVASNKS